jgi:hypothetical protein
MWRCKVGSEEAPLDDRHWAKPGAEGQLCPHLEHALISHPEQEPWDVLLACQAKRRLAAKAQVVGIDMQAALRLGFATIT